MFVSMVKNWKNYVNIYNMTKRIRFIILVICVVLFFVVSPYIVVYSLGYRIDFEGKKITATGGINVRALPQGAEVIVDSKSGGKTSFLSPTVFVQNLLPKKHSILIRKDGYFSYQKTLEVKEKEVTRLDQVILFKEKISFEKLADKTQSPFAKQEQFFIKNNNLYQNNNDKSVLITKNIIAFDVYQNNIYWVGKDNLLYKSDFSGTNKTQVFESFYSPVKNIKISPDGQKILFYNDNEILYSYLNSKNSEKIFLNRFSEKIGDCFWLNDDYLIFNLGEKIVISEIDNRDNLNMVNLSQTLLPADKIYLDQQEKKLYISTKDDLLLSEKLIP